MIDLQEFARPITAEKPLRVVFVCLGNICRSPTGEGIFQHLVKEQGYGSFFEIDSAGTSAYHVGEPANSKSRQVAMKYGVPLLSRARRFEYFDLEYFDVIFAMDSSNYTDIKSLDRREKFGHKVMLFREFDPEPGDKNVPDPYYGGMSGFENVFAMVKRTSQAFLDAMVPYIER